MTPRTKQFHDATYAILRDVTGGQMNHDQKKLSVLEVGTGIAATLIFMWILGGQQSGVTSAAQSNFMGGNPSVEDSDDVRSLRLLFPAGVRSNWHTHSWGQLLMVEEGKGRTQVRGGPVIEIMPGEPWFTAAGVEHWHGAAPDEDALQMTIYEGTVDWLESVPDEQYLATPGQ